MIPLREEQNVNYPLKNYQGALSIVYPVLRFGYPCCSFLQLELEESFNSCEGMFKKT